MTILIADCETDGLLDAMTRLHLIQIGDAETDEVTLYVNDEDPNGAVFLGDLWSPSDLGVTAIRPLREGVERLRAAPKVVFHNGLGFDIHAINHFFPGTLTADRILDTLVMARLKSPEERRHTLRDWGQRLGVLKGDYEGDFQTIDYDLVRYAGQDIVVGRGLYHAVKDVLDWGTSYELEHKVQIALLEQERNGFPFDIEKAKELDIELRRRIHELEVEFARVFPPIRREDWRIAKANNKNRGLVKGERCLFKAWDEPFNPSSRQHIAERLQLAGWVPQKFTETGQPAIDDEVLAGLKFPEAALLAEYLKITKTLGNLSDGKAGYLRLVQPDGRIHGRINGNGARTGRMAHSRPNTANIDTDKRVRSLFIPRPGWKLVGCDGEGIQLRILAHYLQPYDGGKLIDRIVNGKKEDGTDPHSANRDAMRHLGPIDRNGAKTCIYAKLFGSSAGGLANTFKDALRDIGERPVRMAHYALGEAVNKALSVGMTGLDKLEAKAGRMITERGYLIGLDGRRLFSNQARLALVTLCQGGEAVVMKKALVLFQDRAKAAGLEYGLCANVHDEVQIEARSSHAGAVGEMFAQCIADAGVELGVRCPMSGAYQIGDNWAETH